LQQRQEEAQSFVKSQQNFLSKSNIHFKRSGC